MISFITGILLVAVKSLLGVLISLSSWLLWLLWPVWISFGLISLLSASCKSCEAGWLGWLWGSSDARQLERSAEIAQEAARVVTQAAASQAQAAVAQAEQNSRVAEVLGQLSGERQSLAEHIQSLTELGLQDSQLAAALTSAGPFLLCLAILVVAGLALWLVSRGSSSSGHQELLLSDTVDLLVTELAASAQNSGREILPEACMGSGFAELNPDLYLSQMPRGLPWAGQTRLLAMAGVLGNSEGQREGQCEGQSCEPGNTGDEDGDEGEEEPLPF